MFIDESNFEAEENEFEFSNPMSGNKPSYSRHMNSSMGRPSTAQSTTSSLTDTGNFSKQDLDIGDDDSSGGLGSAGGLGTPGSSRARMLAQQRDIQLKKRQQLVQNGGMVRSSQEPTSPVKITDKQFTPSVRQFSAPKAVLESDDDRESEFNRPNPNNKGGSSNRRSNDDDDRSATSKTSKTKKGADLYEVRGGGQRDDRHSNVSRFEDNDEDDRRGGGNGTRGIAERERPIVNRDRENVDGRRYYEEERSGGVVRRGGGRTAGGDDRAGGRRGWDDDDNYSVNSRNQGPRDRGDRGDHPRDRGGVERQPPSRGNGRGRNEEYDDDDDRGYDRRGGGGGGGGRGARGDYDDDRRQKNNRGGRWNDDDDRSEYSRGGARGGRDEGYGGRGRGRGHQRDDDEVDEEEEAYQRARRRDDYYDDERDDPRYDERRDRGDRGRGRGGGRGQGGDDDYYEDDRHGGRGDDRWERVGGGGNDYRRGGPEPAVARASITPLDFSDMRRFLTMPVPRGAGVVQCKIIRNKSGTNKLFPTYTLYLKEGDRFLMTSKKRPNNKTSNYLLSMGEGDLNREGPNYLGKLRSNFVGTEFQIFDNGENPKDADDDLPATAGDRNSRKELGVVMYAPNVLGSRGPRKMQVCCPAVDEHDNILTWKSEKDGEMLARLKDRNFRDLIYLINKPPRWNEQVGAYVLNFNGRVTMASVKNFQLVDPDEQSAVVLQFGRVAKEEFTMDLQWPMSPFQAFAITLSSFDSKIACD